MRAFNVLTVAAAIAWFSCGTVRAEAPPQSNADFIAYAKKLRDDALHQMDPPVAAPTYRFAHGNSEKYPWKTGIVTTIFWIGSAGNSKEPKGASAWDPKWQANYGGFDDPNPEKRRDFIPRQFTPRLNPFYIALPYNDVAKNTTKPEAKVVIPWFKEAFVGEGKSVCRDRWVLIRNSAGKICYAQWADCGPYGTDHWQYVFGNEKPRPNANGGAGLNVSPAVRDYLQLLSTDVTDWKFVDVASVPLGPWAQFGENNPLAHPKSDPENSKAGEALHNIEPLPEVGAGPFVSPGQ
jgi:hypothetical protein